MLAQSNKKQRFFIRRLDGRVNADIFLLAGIMTIMATRLYLAASHYPQLGGRSLHIAHMLWGGLLMTSALGMGLLFLGRRLQKLVALIGGIGFGLFIDELGKFITRDHNYFFRPTIGLVYMIFVVFYLLALAITSNDSSTENGNKHNADIFLEEIIQKGMNKSHKNKIKHLLRPLVGDESVGMLYKLVDSLPNDEAPKRLSLISRINLGLQNWYDRLYQSPKVANWARLVFLLGMAAAFFSLDYVNSVSDNSLFLPSGELVHEWAFFARGQYISTFFTEALLLIGLIVVIKSRRLALRCLYFAALINLLFTQFFLFARLNFKALPIFGLNLLGFGLVKFAMYQERRRTAKVRVVASQNT